jgi:hypothetical protein
MRRSGSACKTATSGYATQSTTSLWRQRRWMLQCLQWRPRPEWTRRYRRSRSVSARMPSDVTNTRPRGRHVAPPQRRDRLNRKYQTLKGRCRALNRLHGILQRHSRSLNRKYATALAFQATSDTVPATRLPLPETPNLAQCPVRRAPIKAKAARQCDGDYLKPSQRTSAWSIPRTRS